MVKAHSARLCLAGMAAFVSPAALLVSSRSAEQMFWEVMRLRREMTTARLGFYVSDQG